MRWLNIYRCFDSTGLLVSIDFVNLFYTFSLFAFFSTIEVLGITFLWGEDMFFQRTLNPLGLVISNLIVV